MKTIHKKIIYLSAFAIAMGFLESAVVVYLRALYYPEGFNFPLKAMPLQIAITELLREFATVVMLLAVGYLSGKTKLQRFAYFCFLFAIWDLFYYVFLYLILAWPESLAAWDILFLLPLPWYGPVWAPCLVAATMLIGALYIIYKTELSQLPNITAIDWLLLIGGASIAIFSFQLDFILSLPSLTVLFQPIILMKQAGQYIPQHFNWQLFLTGYALLAYPVIRHLIYKPIMKTNYEIQ